MKRVSASGIDIDTLGPETGFGWEWFIALGMALITLALVAFLSMPAGTTVPLYVVGIVMSIGALAQLGTALLAPRWRGFGWLVLSPLFYGAAGILVIANPTLSVSAFTLMLACALILSGFMRIWLSVVMPYLPGWEWVGVSGLVSVGAGLVFMGWSPTDSIWINGMVLVGDLAFQGTTKIGFGASLKRLSD